MSCFDCDWRRTAIEKNDTCLNPADIAHGDVAAAATLENLPGLLASPENHRPLRWSNGLLLTAEGRAVQQINQCPVLFPQRVLKHIEKNGWNIPFQPGWDAFDQYLYLNYVKNCGTTVNSEYSDPWYRRHVYRSRDLLENAKGLVLDIGCDDSTQSRKFFPSKVTYIGIDPSLTPRVPRQLIGMAEFLPFASESLDGVSFLTTLDHVFDYHTAIDEAKRVLKSGGTLYLATLIWESNAQLYNDNIHFHHFRDFEIKGALADMTITYLRRYVWKDNSHRYGVYLRASKL